MELTVWEEVVPPGSGVLVDTIKILGDWKSDSVFRYLTPDIRSKFHIIDKALVHLYER